MRQEIKPDSTEQAGWRLIMHRVIFEADTPAGKAFDVALILAILMSVAAVMLESIGTVRSRYGGVLSAAEWFFTILFTVEYILRLLCVGKPLNMPEVFSASSTCWQSFLPMPAC